MTITDLPDLDEVLLGPEPDFDADPESIPPLDREHADRLLRRVAHLDADYEREAAAVRAQVAQLEGWLAGRYETYMAQRGWVSSVLERFHAAELVRDPKAKTLHLPAGDLKMRAQQPSWTFTDTGAFLAWAQEHLPAAVNPADVVPVPASINVNAAKKALTKEIENDKGKVVEKVFGVVPETMERPPGLTVEEVPDKFSIVFPEPEPEFPPDVLCAFCETPGDAVHGPVEAKYGLTGKGRAHKGCNDQHEYDKYEDWRDSQPEAPEGPDADDGPSLIDGPDLPDDPF